jgi:cell division protein ZapE
LSSEEPVGPREGGGGLPLPPPDVITEYERSLVVRGFIADPAQRRAVERLQRLHEEWSEYKRRRRNALRRLLIKPELPRGVYLWGAVGRGKSFLMDAFYRCVPLVRKRRVHFHPFMREIHREMEAAKGEVDPLAVIAERTARRWRLICFDEFHVSDIADAMILGRFLEQVMDRGVEFCMTSNYAPDHLYPDGLQRERFFPAIALLKERLDVLEVDNGTDYRRLKMQRRRVYLTGPPAETTAELDRSFSELADVADEQEALEIEGRRLTYRRRAGAVVWFDFQAICGGPRSYVDYVELARRFHTVFVSDIPAMGAQSSDLARRFTWLIDVLYDERVKLVASAAAPVEQLFTSGVHAAEFARTVSRLTEMQSVEYLTTERARH